MRKVAVAVFIVLGLMVLASCSGPRDPLPTGVWKSEYPHIILFFKPFYQHFASNSYLGLAYVDGEWLKVHTSQFSGRSDNHFSIVRTPASSENTRVFHEVMLFSGGWEIVDDQMHYRILCDGKVITVIFNRITDYEPIDPKYWFPQHESIFGVWESVHPRIVMYIETSYRLFGTARHFPGVFVLDDEEVEVVIYVDRNRIGIHDASYFVLGELQTSASSLIIIGHHEVEDDILRLRLSPSFGSRRYEFSGEIIFDRITERELINPSNQQ